MIKYPNLKDFIRKYNYTVKETLTYNSYRTGQRSETRLYDSISITELLWLIEDPNMEMVKRYYSDKMQEACDYWTKVHKELEDYSNWKKLDPTMININFKIATIKYWLNHYESEWDYRMTISNLPVITGKIDRIVMKDSDKIIVDYKTSWWKRNFKSVKYNLQMAWYRILTWIKKSALLYLNKNTYCFKETKDNTDYEIIFMELIEYANDLFNKWLINNLYKNRQNNM
jgi:hypothetical protein